METMSTFTLIAAGIALVLQIIKAVPAVAEKLAGKERALSAVIGIAAAFGAQALGWLEVPGGIMGAVTTGLALAAASGAAYQHLIKMFTGKAGSSKKIEALEAKVNDKPSPAPGL